MICTKYLKIAYLLIPIFLFACQKEDDRTPEQIERDKIIATENLLRNHSWGFNDLKVSVQYESRAIPLLANIADENGMVQPGMYDSYDIFGNGNRQLYYTYRFLRDEIQVDTTNTGEYSRFGGYFVINTSEIRVNPDSLNALRFNYSYSNEENVFYMQSTYSRNQTLTDFINTRIANSILSGKPGDIADAVVDGILNNENVANTIQQLLYDVIHGKISEVTQSPEELAELLARTIVEKLGELDWETILYDKILELLQKLQVDNPEETATELAARMADKIEASISHSDIYERILPILEEIENERLPVLATKIAEAVYQLIEAALSEENLYNKILPLWEQLANADSAAIEETSDTLASIVVNHIFDADSLTQHFIPFITKIDETNRTELDQLAREIIDTVLIPAVAEINSRFPGLNLDPDWGSIEDYLTSVLALVKTLLVATPVEELARTIANAVITVMDNALQKGFEAALYRLQSVPSEQAASIIASWVVNLVEMAEESIVEFIEGKLNAILERFDAEKIAQEISAIIYDAIIGLFSEENLYQLILPILEALNNVNMERIAELISSWLIESGIIKDNLDPEEVISRLTDILIVLIGNVNPDNVTQQLVDLILQSDIVQDMDGAILKKLLEFKIYQLLLSIGREVNAIELIEVSIKRK